MGIYDISGNLLNTSCDISGNRLNTVYDIEGNEIHIAIDPYPLDYSQYTETDLFTYVSDGFNGFDVYETIIFAVKSNAWLYFFNLTNSSYIERVAITAGHGDSVSFSNEKYDTADPYPLLYCTTDNNPAEIYINRVLSTGTTLVKKLKFPSSAGYYGAGVYDFENGFCYILAYKNQSYLSDQSGTNKTVVSKWNLNSLTDNGDGTFTPEFVSQFERDFIYCMQGLQFFDGYIWVSSGYNNGSLQNVYAMNPSDGTIDYTITLDDTVEVEGIAWVYDEAENKYWMLVGQQNGANGVNYSKIEFATLQTN